MLVHIRGRSSAVCPGSHRPSEGPLGPGGALPFPWGRCGQARLTDFGGADGSMSPRAGVRSLVSSLSESSWEGMVGTAAGVCSAPPSGHTPSDAWRRAEGTGPDSEDASRPIINVSAIRVISTMRGKIKSQVSQISPICRSIRPSYPGPDGDWRVNEINRLLGRKTPNRRICETVFFHVFRTIDVSQIDHYRASH